MPRYAGYSRKNKKRTPPSKNKSAISKGNYRATTSKNKNAIVTITRDLNRFKKLMAPSAPETVYYDREVNTVTNLATGASFVTWQKINDLPLWDRMFDPQNVIQEGPKVFIKNFSLNMDIRLNQGVDRVIYFTTFLFSPKQAYKQHILTANQSVVQDPSTWLKGNEYEYRANDNGLEMIMLNPKFFKVHKKIKTYVARGSTATTFTPTAGEARKSVNIFHKYNKEHKLVTSTGAITDNNWDQIAFEDIKYTEQLYLVTFQSGFDTTTYPSGINTRIRFKHYMTTRQHVGNF